jgi:hypothetical protein
MTNTDTRQKAKEFRNFLLKQFRAYESGGDHRVPCATELKRTYQVLMKKFDKIFKEELQ